MSKKEKGISKKDAMKLAAILHKSAARMGGPQPVKK